MCGTWIVFIQNTRCRTCTTCSNPERVLRTPMTQTAGKISAPHQTSPVCLLLSTIEKRQDPLLWSLSSLFSSLSSFFVVPVCPPCQFYCYHKASPKPPALCHVFQFLKGIVVWCILEQSSCGPQWSVFLQVTCLPVQNYVHGCSLLRTGTKLLARTKF